MAHSVFKWTRRESPEAKVQSIRTFLKLLEQYKPEKKDLLFFRGHENSSYTLVPSVYRNEGWISNEDVIIKELILRCPTEFQNCESTFQTLVRMQHYSLPTRLLDITTNPLIALYFACAEGRNPKEDGEVIVFRVPIDEVKYFDSDTVSVIANVSRRPLDFSVPAEKQSIQGFNKRKEIALLLHEVRAEKPYFRAKIRPEHIQSVVCVKPKLDNARIVRQDGAFFLFGINRTKNKPANIPEHYQTGAHSRIYIDSGSKKRILGQLEALGITKGVRHANVCTVFGNGNPAMQWYRFRI